MKLVSRTAALILLASGLSAAQAPAPATGHWKITGDVQGVAVSVSCDLIVKDADVTGTCVDDVKKSRTATGSVKDSALSFSFPSEYDGGPIVLQFAGRLDDTGTTMSGSIYCPQYQAAGDFTAKKSAPDAATPTA